MFRRIFAIFLFSLSAGLGSINAWAQPPAETGFVATEPPRAVPLFQFENEKGHNLDLKDFGGRYVLLNLWATSCAPCVAEMPALNELSKKLAGSKFAIVALSEDPDAPAAARLFYSRHSIDRLAVYSDSSGRAPFILHTHGIPTTLLIDPHGFEIARLEGAADWTGDSVMSFLKARIQP
jgi:thiol-disulfide isomerase/thioredoxin